MKIWTGSSNPMSLTAATPLAVSWTQPRLEAAIPLALVVPTIPPKRGWNPAAEPEVSIARFEGGPEVQQEARSVEVRVAEVEQPALSTRLGMALRPSSGEFQPLWTEPALALELERSALSPAPQDPLETKHRIFLQPLERACCQGLPRSNWVACPAAVPDNPCDGAPELLFSPEALSTYPPETGGLDLSGLSEFLPVVIHQVQETAAPEPRAATLYPGFRLLPNLPAGPGN